MPLSGVSIEGQALEDQDCSVIVQRRQCQVGSQGAAAAERYDDMMACGSSCLMVRFCESRNKDQWSMEGDKFVPCIRFRHDDCPQQAETRVFIGLGQGGSKKRHGLLSRISLNRVDSWDFA
jgi:hypothetical protein